MRTARINTFHTHKGKIMRTLTIEIDKVAGGFQVVERTRENGLVVNEVKYEVSMTRAGAEKMRLGGEQSFAKFLR